MICNNELQCYITNMCLYSSVIGCANSRDCPYSLACHNGECVDPCSVNNPCSNNAVCFSNQHKAECRCPPGLEGDPYVKCETQGCKVDTDCPKDHTCLKNQCTDACAHSNCANDTICYPQDHKGLCKCPAGYEGDPTVKCERTEEPACTSDQECEVGLACISYNCQNPCGSQLCGDNAECQVVESLPFKSMTCKCLPGYQGDANIQCRQSKD